MMIFKLIQIKSEQVIRGTQILSVYNSVHININDIPFQMVHLVIDGIVLIFNLCKMFAQNGRLILSNVKFPAIRLIGALNMVIHFWPASFDQM